MLYIDAAITDPPYYDSVTYSNLSDFFYVWLKRSISQIYRDDFAAELTPKRNEAIAAFYRHGDDRNKSRSFYEATMAQTLVEARRVLRPGGPLIMIYAHKTTAGWATLVDSLRTAGFEIHEAWPLETELKGGLRLSKAMLASSIFLVARKRSHTAGVGNYEDDVQPELQRIVRERVETLWDMGIAGADLVIACVGAGLRAFTKYEKVEYANGEEVPAEKFLAEVEGVVLDTMMAKLSGVVGGNVSAVDNSSRFYVLWRFVYKTAELDAGEAIVFSNGTHIELDGSHGLSAGKDALIEKKKAKYHARDFTERGSHDKLGLPNQDGQPAPLIDALHRILWLMENSPRKLAEFLDEARPDRERLRVLAQALSGAALSGKSEADAGKLVSTTSAEQAALGKLLANWRNLIEEGVAAAVVGKKAARQDKEDKQARFEYGRGSGQG
jgi:putative DNA methylase